MKEFVEKTGLAYEDINLAAKPERAEKLTRLGLGAPAVVIGERGVQGLDLVGIADLIGYDYEPPAVLPVVALHEKYLLISHAASRLIAQVPPEGLEYKSPDRDRTLRVLAGHVGSIIRAFLRAYEDDIYEPWKYLNAPSEVRSVEQLLEWNLATRDQYETWWERSGQDDPLDRVLDTTFGYWTLHQIFERCVWHTAQHTRQVAIFLENLGIEPDHPLTTEDLAGLPVPDRIFS